MILNSTPLQGWPLEIGPTILLLRHHFRSFRLVFDTDTWGLWYQLITYSQSAWKAESTSVYFNGFYRHQFSSKNVPLVPLRDYWKIEFHRNTVVALKLHVVFGSCRILNALNLFGSVKIDFPWNLIFHQSLRRTRGTFFRRKLMSIKTVKIDWSRISFSCWLRICY